MAEPLNAIEGASIEGKQLRDADKAQCFSAMRMPGVFRQMLELKMPVSYGNRSLFMVQRRRHGITYSPAGFQWTQYHKSWIWFLGRGRRRLVLWMGTAGCFRFPRPHASSLALGYPLD